MERRQGIMDMALFTKVVDECAELGIEHVRMHNYGEPFVDRQLVDKVRYAKQRGIPQVGMISNGSLITEAAARGMIEAGLDAINISVDASGKETFEKTRVGLKYDKVIGNVERLLALRDAAGTRRPKLILSFVRQNNSEDEHAFIEHWRKRADKIHITDLHNWAGTLNQKSDVNYPCYRPVADVHGALGRPGVAVLRGLRRPHHSRRPADVDHRRDLEFRSVPRRAPRAPRKRGPRHLPVVRPSEEGLAALDYEVAVGRAGRGGVGVRAVGYNPCIPYREP